MKTKNRLTGILAARNLRLFTLAAFAAASFPIRAIAQTVAFTWPGNGQSIVSFAGLAGTAQAGAGTIQEVVFSVYDQSIGQWWNGTNYQGGQVWLAASVNGTHWTPAGSVSLPAVLGGQYYQLAAQVTDSAANVAATNITVQGDSVPPVVAFAPLSAGQIVNDLSTIGGSVSDSFTTVASVVFTLQELDINGGPGRWWSGSNFQSSAVPLPASISAGKWSPAAGVGLPSLNSGQSYALTATALDALSNSASTNITVTDAMTMLAWDPGQTPGGTVLLPNPNTNGGNYWFQIIPQSPAVGVWRTALNVLAGGANVYLEQGSPPNIYSHNFASANAGSNGFVVDASQFNAGQNWYILVNAASNAQWTLMSGDVFVYNLGSLAADSSSSTNAPIGAEGMAFFQTTIPSTTLAWQLWINGAANQMYVKKSAAPDPVSYDLTQAGQMLVVPPYLAGGTFNGTYFTGVLGAPGTSINLDSRQQLIVPLAFTSTTNVAVGTTNFPYVTYQIQVPVQQIAWQLNLTPTSGNPAIAVRRDLVPNEFRNDAFSEVPQGVGASVSLVPPPPNSGAGTPGLSDGTWYVTVYSTAPYTCAFVNANPVITTVDYIFSITNDAPNRAGWRYYQVTDIADQLGSLGWALTLANQVPGTEIAIRRNAVPGQWNYRNYDDYYWSNSLGYVDMSSSYGLLQQPGHQADIWYIGVYTPNQALGNFVLTGGQLTGQPMPLDGAGSSVSVANQPPGQWGFFKITVPADPELLGWDLRLVNITNGNPAMVVCRDTLPGSLNNGGSWNGPYGVPGCSSAWPSGNQWLDEDWTGTQWAGLGLTPWLVMGLGSPLQAGTYYIGVQDPNNASSYTLQSRGIGTNYTIAVRNLAFDGSATNPALAVGEGDYYRIVVPGNAPDWKMQLNATAGKVLLKVQRDYLPNSGGGWPDGSYSYVQAGEGGQTMLKAGDEQWALLPYNYGGNGTNLLAGTYYAVVVSQGQNLNSSYGGRGYGTGSSGYTLSSWPEPAVVLANTLSYGNDLLLTNAQAGGETKFYQFAVPAGIASVEVTLEEVVGTPVMALNCGTNLVSPYYYWESGSDYGNYGGTNYQWYNSSLITIPNVAPGPYSLSIHGVEDGSGAFPDASYVLRVHAAPPPVVAFDGGTLAVANQAAGTWGFFKITVPADPELLGWDLRLVNITNGNPAMVVCRDTLPGSLNNGGSWNGPYGVPGCSSAWPSGNQWLDEDWTGTQWAGLGLTPWLVMGLGSPLQAGTYYIGVQDPNNASSYTLQSRGIGTNYTIAVRNLAFDGSATNPALAVGEGDYYRIVVPGNAPDWKMQLNATAGKVLLKVQRDYLPNSGGGWPDGSYSYVQAGEGGQTMLKAGDEQWALLPYNYGGNGTNLLAGTYYAVVVSQGQNLNSSYGGRGYGTGSSGYTLSSWPEPAVVLANTLSYGNDLLLTNAQAGGETKFYQFAVPVGIASMEVTLEDVVGTPIMALSGGTALVSPYYYWESGSDYGNYGGTNYQWYNSSLITIPNVAPGPYSLSIHGVEDGSGAFPDASYVLRVHAAPPPVVAFDGGTLAVANQAAGTWGFFKITVPADPELLGWDLRLVNITNGNPAMVVCRDTLPGSLNNGGSWNGPYGVPGCSSAWPSGNQWLDEDWTGTQWAGLGLTPWLVMGLGSPLQAGTYYIGVQDPNNASSYTLQSRGIGTNYTIAVRNLAFDGSATNPALAVGEGDYYRIVVPGNAPDWKMQLNATAGKVLLKVQRDYLPNSGGGWPDGSYSYVQAGEGGQTMLKAGDEQWALLPYNYGGNGTNLLAGTYYAVVVSQGQNLNSSYGGRGYGTGSSGYTLSSWPEPAVVLANTLSYGNDLLLTNAQAGGETKFYQFAVPVGIASMEVTLEDVVGTPIMALSGGTALVSPYYYWESGSDYGNYGGTNYQWYNSSLITIPNVAPGPYSLSIHGVEDGSGAFPDASYVLRVRAMVPPLLSFSPELDSRGLTNVASDVLADTEHVYYEVTIPALVNGAPVLGWKLDLTAINGSPTLRVRENLLPDNTCDTSMYGSGTVIIAPPYLTPGTWYVDVVGSGSTAFTLTSSAITTNTLAHPLWTMPAVGRTTTAPGLVFPAIGDSGVDGNGNPILDPQTGTVTDQGIDLKQGHFDIYAVVVPTNNAAVLRTELQAISGNPNLYLRAGAAPTLNHYAGGSCDWWDSLVERQLTGGTTEYGNWVPLNGRYQTALTPGIWVLAVQAGGNANARYRLQLACGNPTTNGLVQDLDLGSGGFTNQNLNGGDWRYYRVQIPDPAPANWVVTWTRSLGSARLFVRDTVPPGDGNDTNPNNYPNSGYNPGPGSSDLQTWNSDAKNEGPYPRFDTPGTANLTTPPLRPGSVYYLGFWSPVDTTFSFNSSTNGGAVIVTNITSFLGGTMAGNIPGYGSLVYRMDVPASATRILFNASNTTDIVFSLEQGTIALPGGPAHWTSYLYNNPQYGGQNNVTFDQLLSTANNWPWLPGYTYYLAVTNTSPNAEDFGVYLSLPADLAPVALTAPTSITSTAPNPTVQAVWCVTNQGMATTVGGWYDTVWFSTNGVLDANSINIGNFWCPGGYWSPQPVPPEGSYWQTNSVTLPMTGSGNYTLFVQADAGNSIYESSLSDKVSAPVNGAFTLTPPDLMPFAFSAPTTVTAAQANPTIQVVWAVTNQGIGLASGGWYDRVWFSTNGELDAQSVDIGDFYWSQSVAPGGFYWQTNNVILPVSLGGMYSYSLFVQVDVYNWVFESNKVNNISAPVPGTLMLDLPPTIVTQPVSRFVAAGGTATFSVAANGTPPLSYQWQLNNANLAAATNAALVLGNVVPTNAGAYMVLISNAFGAVTSSVANLIVANLSTTMVQNFGFETPGLGGGYQYNPTGAGWMFLNGAGISGNQSGFTSGNPNAPEGVQAAFLQGAGSSISQGIAFAAGNYEVVFSAAERANISQAGQTLSVTLDGQVIGTYAPPESATNYADYITSSFTLTNGIHTLSFAGTDLNGGDNTLFLDNVRVVVTPPPQISSAGFSSNGGFQLIVYGQIGQAYTLQVSTNLTSWASLLTFTCTNSPMCVVDPTAKNFSLRFYRLVQGTVLAPITLGFGSAKPWTTNGLYLMLQGTIGPNYVIQATTDLLHWLPITNFASTNSPVYFYDPAATNYSRRFYRVQAGQ